MFGYSIHVHQALIRSEDDLVHQDATASRCSLKMNHCQPVEDRKQILVYQDDMPILPNAYKYLGDYQVTQVESIISIPDLGSGGSIAHQEGNTIILDTGYLLRMKQVECYTVFKNNSNQNAISGKPCIFPFTFKGGKHSSCTSTQTGELFWCSIKTDSAGMYLDDNWGWCPDSECGKVQNNTETQQLKLHNLAVDIAKMEVTSPAVERLAGSMTLALAKMESRLQNLEYLACRTAGERTKMKQLLLNNLPYGDANSLLGEEQGVYLEGGEKGFFCSSAKPLSKTNTKQFSKEGSGEAMSVMQNVFKIYQYLIKKTKSTTFWNQAPRLYINMG